MLAQTQTLEQTPLRQLIRIAPCFVEVVPETNSIIFHDSNGDLVIHIEDAATWQDLATAFKLEAPV